MNIGKYVDRTGAVGVVVGAMTDRVRNGFRRSVPATSAVCRAELAGLREQIDAAYVRQHAYVQQTGNWFTGLLPLFYQYGSARYSLWRLRRLMPQEAAESQREYYLERILAFASVA